MQRAREKGSVTHQECRKPAMTCRTRCPLQWAARQPAIVLGWAGPRHLGTHKMSSSSNLASIGRRLLGPKFVRGGRHEGRLLFSSSSFGAMKFLFRARSLLRTCLSPCGFVGHGGRKAKKGWARKGCFFVCVWSSVAVDRGYRTPGLLVWWGCDFRRTIPCESCSFASQTRLRPLFVSPLFPSILLLL